MFHVRVPLARVFFVWGYPRPELLLLCRGLAIYEPLRGSFLVLLLVWRYGVVIGDVLVCSGDGCQMGEVLTG